MPDKLTPEQRSRLMSRIHGKDTGIERAVRSDLHRRGFRFRKHVQGLPGKPDIVYPSEKVAVFVDGDFWHGYRLPQWEHTLTEYWREKLTRNRRRDQRNFRRLRRMGWTVIRIWQHEIERDLSDCIQRVVATLGNRVSNTKP